MPWEDMKAMSGVAHQAFEVRIYTYAKRSAAAIRCLGSFPVMGIWYMKDEMDQHAAATRQASRCEMKENLLHRVVIVDTRIRRVE